MSGWSDAPRCSCRSKPKVNWLLHPVYRDDAPGIGFESLSSNNQSFVKVTHRSSITANEADFEEILAVENDLINGRGAWLYSQLEKELARERKRAQAERQFEALRAESYKYNF